MGEKIIVEAIYENGVLKPLTPLNLAEKQTVRLEIAIEEDAAQPERNIVKLGGIWAQYLVGEELSYEEIEELTSKEHAKSLERLLRQIDGDFSEDEVDG